MAVERITAERLREVLAYDPEDGRFRRRGGRTPGAIAGGVSAALGYRMIGVDYGRYYEHRLAWLYVHGCWPTEQVDHINGDRLDNRIANLREATNYENIQNSVTPRGRNQYRGVSFHPQTGRWRARIGVAGRTRHLGLFDTPEDAYDAYLFAKAQVHPFWAVAA